ncbi:unnamed protein product [Lactuca virosa]|uniref:Uncharacterized protein n=1 Tax=Lactuca virosa TaxID=75947 RepID=A0AAU9NTZ8_9ASTR|nr:unnamed protein product [Lactuca virosa]
MEQSRKSAKVAYQGLKELVKFGKFVEIEDKPAVVSINVEVAYEHVAPKPKFQFAIEEIELSDDEEDQEDQENELTEKEFEDFIQQSISNPKKDAAVTPPVVTERESDTMMQSSIPTPEQMDALIAEVQRNTRKPPQTVPVATESPSKSYPEDSAYVLLPKNRKRRDPRIFKAQLLKKKSYLQKDLKLQAAHLKHPRWTSPKAKASCLSLNLLMSFNFRTESLICKNSTEKDLVIGKQDIRISELEKENSGKDSNISELQANLGGLTALFFDLKQRQFQKFGDEFQP